MALTAVLLFARLLAVLTLSGLVVGALSGHLLTGLIVAGASHLMMLSTVRLGNELAGEKP